MKQFLARLFDRLRRVFDWLAAASTPVIALLRSVNIDQRRGALFCVGLQLITIVVLIIAFRRDPDLPSRPVPGDTAPASPERDTTSALGANVLEMSERLAGRLKFARKSRHGTFSNSTTQPTQPVSLTSPDRSLTMAGDSSHLDIVEVSVAESMQGRPAERLMLCHT